MAINLLGLDSRMQRRADQVEEGTDRFVGTTGLEIIRAVVPATPVLTGLARGNWRSGTREPIDVEINRLSPSGAAPIAEAISVSRSVPREGSFFIVNSALHLPRLNEGSSPQAPAGFVEDAVQRGVAIARSRRSRFFR